MSNLVALYTEREIRAMIETLAEKIVSHYVDRNLAVVCILKGAAIFGADLVRALSRYGMHCEVDFITATSYVGTERISPVRITYADELLLTGKQVLLVDDILDSGITLRDMVAHLSNYSPAFVRTCVLLEKQTGSPGSKFRADCIGFLCPDKFVVGYGMDLDEQYRDLPFIAELREK